MDSAATRINTLTSCCLQRSRIPLTFPTDREVIAQALETCWRLEWSEARIVVIPNTLELEHLWISAPLDSEAKANPYLHFETDYQALPFLPDGTLNQAALFPRSVQGKRAAAKSRVAG